MLRVNVAPRTEVDRQIDRRGGEAGKEKERVGRGGEGKGRKGKKALLSHLSRVGVGRNIASYLHRPHVQCAARACELDAENRLLRLHRVPKSISI